MNPDHPTRMNHSLKDPLMKSSMLLDCHDGVFRKVIWKGVLPLSKQPLGEKVF